MERGYLALGCLLLFQVLPLDAKFSIRPSTEEESKKVFISCNCHSVEIWLNQRNGSDGDLPSYQQVAANMYDDHKGIYIWKELRLWPRKQCEIHVNQDEVSVLKRETRSQNKMVTSGAPIQVFNSLSEDCKPKFTL